MNIRIYLERKESKEDLKAGVPEKNG